MFVVHAVSSLEQQVKGQEGVAAYTPSHSLELRKLRKERNELREAVTNFETELMQVLVHTEMSAKFSFIAPSNFK